jgi:hypothetical protein
MKDKNRELYNDEGSIFQEDMILLNVNVPIIEYQNTCKAEIYMIEIQGEILESTNKDGGLNTAISLMNVSMKHKISRCTVELSCMHFQLTGYN